MRRSLAECSKRCRWPGKDRVRAERGLPEPPPATRGKGTRQSPHRSYRGDSGGTARVTYGSLPPQGQPGREQPGVRKGQARWLSRTAKACSARSPHGHWPSLGHCGHLGSGSGRKISFSVSPNLCHSALFLSGRVRLLLLMLHLGLCTDGGDHKGLVPGCGLAQIWLLQLSGE